MSRRGRVVRSERKWIISSYDFVFSTVVSIVVIPIAKGTDITSTDELSGFAEGWERMNRVIGAWGIRTNGPAQAAPDSVPFLGLGILRGVATDAVSPSVLSSNFSDRSWVWRSYYALPVDLAPQERDSSTTRFDWPLRGGRGTNIDRDVELQLVASLSGVQYNEANVYLQVLCNFLGEVS